MVRAEGLVAGEGRHGVGVRGGGGLVWRLSWTRCDRRRGTIGFRGRLDLVGMLWLRAQCVVIGCVSCLWRLLKRWIGGVMLHDGDAVGCTWKGYGCVMIRNCYMGGGIKRRDGFVEALRHWGVATMYAMRRHVCAFMPVGDLDPVADGTGFIVHAR